MPHLLGVLLRSVGIGVMVAAPVGAMSMLCVQRTVRDGARRGLVTGAAIATADGLYASVAAFGLTAVSTALVAWQPWLRLLGGTFLVWLGIAAFKGARAECGRGGDTPAGVALYGSTVLLTLTNPMTIVAFAAVFAGAGLVTDGRFSTALVTTLGVAMGSAAWWGTLVCLASLVRARSSDRLVGTLGYVSASVLLAFGLVAAVSGGRMLLAL